MRLIRYVAGIFMLTLGAAALAQEPIVIKFSHVVAPETPKGRAADRFKQLAEERTKGRVKVEVYPNSTLFKDHEEMQALQLNKTQIIAPSLALFGPIGAREFTVFALPYIFPNKDVLYRVMDGEIGQTLFNNIASKGIVGLAYWDNGFRQMTGNKPLRKTTDFQGVKMRIENSLSSEAQMQVLGAIPQKIPFNNVYNALKQGMAEGAENPLSNIRTQKFYEVQKHLTVSDHNYLGYGVIANKVFWDGLPVEVRDVLVGAMRDATKYEREIAQKENDDALAAIRAAGTTEIYVLSDAERREWHKVLLEVHRKLESTIGRELIQSIYNVAAQVEKEKGRK